MSAVQNLVGFAAVTKMKIKNQATGEIFEVMYNPESFELSKSTNYKDLPGLNTDAPSTQFINGQAETLKMELFFDTYSSGAEIGGSPSDKLSMQLNAAKPSAYKMDVRKFTDKVYQLMFINADTHAPPQLKLMWDSLQFDCIMTSCAQRFTKFSEKGTPVRAILSVTFQRYTTPTKSALMKANNSPDTAKFRAVHEGDSLWALAAAEYGTCDQWRKIAEANEISNPRLLDTGENIAIPAL